MTITVIRNNGALQVVSNGRGPAGSQTVTIPIFYGAAPASGELLSRAILPMGLRIVSAECAASCDSPPSVEQVYALTLDNASVGTVTFGAGETEGVVDITELTWAPGILRVQAPGLCDTAIADISITIVGNR